MLTISPGETLPPAELAAFTTPVMVGSGADTVRVTLMVVEPVAAPVALTTMVPVYVFALRFAGFTVTVTGVVPVVAVVPLVGDTESQLLPVVACAVKPRLCPPPETFTVCVEGFAPPTWYVNVSVVGVAVTVGAACTVRLTVTDTTVPPVGVIVMVAV